MKRLLLFLDFTRNQSFRLTLFLLFFVGSASIHGTTPSYASNAMGSTADELSPEINIITDGLCWDGLWDTRISNLTPESGECGTIIEVNLTLAFYYTDFSTWYACTNQTVVVTLGSQSVTATTNIIGEARAEIMVTDPAATLTVTYAGGGLSGCPNEKYESSSAAISFENFSTLGSTGSISGLTGFCVGAEDVPFSIPEVSNAINYTWTVPSDATIIQGQWTNAIRVDFGEASGDITVTPNNHCHTGTTSSKAVTLYAVPGRPVEILGEQTVCKGSSQTYSIAPVENAERYSWAPPYGWDGSSTSTSIALTPTYVSSPGYADLSVQAINGSCRGSSTSLMLFSDDTPSTPNRIEGPLSTIEGIPQAYDILTYEVDPNRPSATSYTWTLPSGWEGSSTTDIIQTTPGSSSGNISIVANNSCGSSYPKTITVAVEPAPQSPGEISGPNEVCPGAAYTYSISPIADATSYEWSVPEGWSISEGQGTSSINVISGSAGQHGEISVTPAYGAASYQGSYVTEVIPAAADWTGYIDYRNIRHTGDIKVNDEDYMGYIKFPLNTVPLDATIRGSSLYLTNLDSPLRSSYASYVVSMGILDPVTTSSSTVYGVIRGASTSSTAQFSIHPWRNLGPLLLSLNYRAKTQIQSIISSTAPGEKYIGMGLVRQTPFTYMFHGHSGGENMPRLAIIYTAEAETGFSSTLAVMVEDNTPPDITCPAEVTIECDAQKDPLATGSAEATDNCGGDVTLTFSDEIIPGSCDNAYTIVRTWTATDVSENASECSQIIKVVDTTPPDITCPANVTIECDMDTNPSAMGIATATDNCGGELTLTFSDEIIPGSCANEYNILRTWRAEDACGNVSNCIQTINIVDTSPPTITCAEDKTLICGEEIVFDEPTSSDNCDTPFITEVSTVTNLNDCGIGTYTRTWVATDCAENSSQECSQTITIVDVPVSIGMITVNPSDPIPLNGMVYASATYLDNQPGNAEWDWGDGTTDDGDIGQEITGEHSYAQSGVYVITLTIGKCCAVNSMEYRYVVVYNPDDGFVTGGGWIDSPPGAFVSDLNAAGKAIFGFVSKYKNGKTIPEGNTEFQFKAGNLNFNSYVYDWLVIAGSKAKFKGEGTINGSGAYGFMLSAVDGDLKDQGEDLFRIKIWDKLADDALIYDNQIGDDDDADAATAIGGGSIVIHTKETELKSASIVEPVTKVNIYPNPFDNLIYVDLVTESTHEIIIDMIDMNGRVIEYLYTGIISAELDHHFEFNTKAELTPGSYMLRVRTKNGELLEREIIIKR